MLGNRKRSEPVSNQTGYPEDDFYLTTKSADEQELVLESYPVTLKMIGNFTGMFWKATPTKGCYFPLTSQDLGEKDLVLEGSDGKSAAVMVPNNGVHFSTSFRTIILR